MRIPIKPRNRTNPSQRWQRFLLKGDKPSSPTKEETSSSLRFFFLLLGRCCGKWRSSAMVSRATWLTAVSKTAWKALLPGERIASWSAFLHVCIHHHWIHQFSKRDINRTGDLIPKSHIHKGRSKSSTCPWDFLSQNDFIFLVARRRITPRSIRSNKVTKHFSNVNTK